MILSFLGLMPGAFAQGLLWAVMAIGVYITYRILDIADLTAEGCFTLGAAVTCKLVTLGWDPFTSTIVSFLAGLLAGLVTGLLHTKLKIPALLSGILTMTALWSVNLRVMGQSNIPLLKQTTIISLLEDVGLTKNVAAIVAGLVLTVFVIFILWIFFNTELGFSLRATGDNKNMIRAQGVNTDNTLIFGIMLGNGLIAVSSSLVAQFNGFADISMGTGTIVNGLAAIILAEVIVKYLPLGKRLWSIVVGAVLYRLVLVMILAMNVDAQMLKLASAILLAIILYVPEVRQKLKINPNKSLTPGGDK